jgi:hypothetical protein
MMTTTMRFQSIRMTAELVLCLILLSASNAWASSNDNKKKRPKLILSTDVATGLIDTHGGKSLSPVSFSSSYAWGNDTE